MRGRGGKAGGLRSGAGSSIVPVPSSEAKQDTGPDVSGPASLYSPAGVEGEERQRRARTQEGENEKGSASEPRSRILALHPRSRLRRSTHSCSINRHVIVPVIGRALALILHPHIGPDGHRRLGLIARRHDDTHRLVLDDRGRRCHKHSSGQAGRALREPKEQFVCRNQYFVKALCHNDLITSIKESVSIRLVRSVVRLTRLLEKQVIPPDVRAPASRVMLPHPPIVVDQQGACR
jgi:hypothetical protein